MEHWKRNDLTLHVGDLDVPIIMSNDEEVEDPPSSEESYIVHPLAKCIDPIFTGQCTIHSAPWEYQKVRKEEGEVEGKGDDTCQRDMHCEEEG